MRKLTAILTLVVLTGCNGNWDKAHTEFMTDFTAGNFEQAGDKMSAATVANNKPNNIYLGGLHCGNAYLWTPRSEERQMCFDAASDVIAGNVDEDSSYKVKSYEKILLKTYEAAGFLADGSKDAKQMFLQAYDLQTQNVEENGEEIQELREKFAEDQKTLNENGKKAPGLDEMVAAVNAELESAEDTVAPMKDYVNPYTTWLSAIYDGTHGDMANAKNYLARVAQFAPDNSFVKTDAESLKNGKSVWVVFENGLVGPVGERSLAPALLRALNIKVTIPDLYPGTLAARSVRVETQKENVETQFLASIESVVKTDLDKYKTENIIKSISFEIGKVAAATLAGIAADRATKDSPFHDIAVAAAVAGVMSVEKPWDLRSWDSIPAQVQMARVKMPADKKVSVEGMEVELPDDANNAIVFVRIPTVTSQISVISAKLN